MTPLLETDYFFQISWFHQISLTKPVWLLTICEKTIKVIFNQNSLAFEPRITLI